MEAGEIVKALILALLEGLTEFLPVSSTGHLIAGAALLDFRIKGAVFEIFIQFGAVVAAILHYRSTLGAQLGDVLGSAATRRLWLRIALASAPAAFLGWQFSAQIEALLFSPSVVALSLIIGGVVFLLVERLPNLGAAQERELGGGGQVTMRQALWIGLAQALALIPGISRSGASIVGGMLAGLDRRAATEFSFLVAIPLLGGATVYKFANSFSKLQADDLALLLLGTVVAGIVARISIGWLLGYVSRHSFVAFGMYRIVIGCLILLGVSSGLFN